MQLTTANPSCRELDRTITSALSIGATLSPRRLLSLVHRTAVAITGIHTEYAEHSVRCFRLGEVR